jgi:formylglycine-generating enzyme required for sulfatase activity
MPQFDTFRYEQQFLKYSERLQTWTLPEKIKQIPQPFQDWVEKCLVVDANKRVQSPHELQWVDPSTPAPQPQPEPVAETVPLIVKPKRFDMKTIPTVGSTFSGYITRKAWVSLDQSADSFTFSSHAKTVIEVSLGQSAADSTFSDYTETVNGVSFEMKAIPGGPFQMGSNGGFDAQKTYEMLNNFYMGKFEVTQRLWVAVMGYNPSEFKDCPDCPVEHVSWNDAQAFLKKLNALTGKKYQLPTEAQWEYGACGGQSYQYAGSDDLDAVAWHDGNSDYKAHAVGGKLANGYGLYDMSGNVWEWCADCSIITDSSNRRTDTVNPIGVTVIIGYLNRVLRGGSWDNGPRNVRVAHRNNSDQSNRCNNVGFRVALSVDTGSSRVHDNFEEIAIHN